MRTLAAIALMAMASCVDAQSAFTAEESARIVSHGPWPPALRRDASNRVSGKPQAIALGERLFFDPGLSGTGSVLCASCHIPFRSFQDARARAFGLAQVDRNTPSLVNVGLYHWYGWDGAHDSLWSQSIRPLLEPREMGATPAHVAAHLRSRYAQDYEGAFGHPVPADDEQAFVDAGKALAAFQETLVSGRTPFDDFRDALERGDTLAAARYPVAAQRGAALFVGKAQCDGCHAGPSFSNGEFARTASSGGRIDAIARLKASPYNLLSRYSDERSGAAAIRTASLEPQLQNAGQFRVPGLRNVALTAPYMHDGSLATLREVVDAHAPAELSARARADLVAFLRSLTEAGALK